MELSEFLKELRDETLHPLPAPEIPEPESIREKIEKILSDGPRPYDEILKACGGNEDALRDAIRDAIRDMPEIVAFDDRGVWIWELSRDPVSIGERVGIRFENESPANLGKPVYWYKGVPLACENDPPHIRLYAWVTCHLFPGRPLSIDIEPTARLLELSPREVREALQRLTKDGDLVMTREKGRELYRLNIQYPEGGTEA